MACALVVLAMQPVGASAKDSVKLDNAEKADKDAVKLGVEVVDDIDDVEVYSSVQKSMHNVFKFELDGPAIVDVGITTNVYCDATLGKDPAGNTTVYGGSWRTSDNATNRVYLEKGVYYIVFKPSSSSPEQEFSASVLVQYVDRTVSNNNKIKDAKEVSIKEPITGFLSSSVRSQNYKFKLSNKSKVEISAMLDAVYSVRTSASNKVKVKASLYDKNYKLVKSSEFGEDSKDRVLNISATLEKGTYYLGIEEIAGVDVFTKGNSLMHFGEVFININATKTTLKAPKVVGFKAKAKKITGTAESGSEVFLIHNNKVYFGTVDKNGKYSVKTSALKKGANIQAFVIKDGVKSKTTTVKVK